ncbi:nucleotide disphospho-sugar-binding domain-containing protein [Actinomadura rayongensis]|uniref:DUF1205 domain-containing protein n=1 Tax=Actinomadura rayongensis TaxID=1429076 RepID=A0A6I4W0I7_9ACTN|nr:nucleotide disphospho-sugar-binding domain-containing protein [Actinomadura rayongensis]MXQ63023.1 DUF1205 domain-containing protein [Actinomadura rayongensis]
MKILFSSAGSPATVFAIAPLATAVRNAGHEVFVSANADMVPAITGVGLPAISVTSRPLKDFVTKDRAGDPVPRPQDPTEELQFVGRWFGRLAAESLEPLRELSRHWRPDVVVGGSMSYVAGLLAASLGVPYVRQTIDTTETTGIDPGAAAELAPELADLGLSGLPDPDLLVDICPPSLRPPGAPAARPMRWTPGNRQSLLEPWMYTRGERKRVCVTMGSRVLLTHNVDFLAELAAAVGALDVEVVVAAPDQAAERLRDVTGVRAGWVPLDVVARTCDLIVHHGGGVTSMTAMHAGVPQLILPDSAYSAVPARRIADLGAGLTVRLGEDTSDVITTACKEILSDPAFGRNAAAIAAEIAALPGPAAVAAEIGTLGAG